MFRNREARQLEDLTVTVGPYRNIGASFEVDGRLDAFDQQLLLTDRHLLTSNDHYQAEASYLVLAHNRYAIVEAVYQSVTKTGGEDIQGSMYSPDHVKNFLIGGYQSVKHALEAADTISVSPGFKMTADEALELAKNFAPLAWPGVEQVSNRFLEGCVEALTVVQSYMSTKYRKASESPFLPNQFKFKLQQHAAPLLGELDNKQKAIKRITGGLIEDIKSRAVAQDILTDVMEAFLAADQLTIWLTMPKVHDRAFELADPLDESRRDQRKFNPASVGGMVVQATIQAAPRPAPSGRPFTGLTAPPPAPKTATPPQPRRSFDPGTLEAPQPASLPHPQRAFKADSLEPLEPTEKRRFTRDTLQSTPPPKAQPQPRRGFDPASLTQPENTVSKTRPQRPFSPEAIVTPAKRPEEQVVKRSFDPKNIKGSRKTFDPSILKGSTDDDTKKED